MGTIMTVGGCGTVRISIDDIPVTGIQQHLMFYFRMRNAAVRCKATHNTKPGWSIMKLFGHDQVVGAPLNLQCSTTANARQ